MPLFHVLFVFCILGSFSSIHALITRWDSFRIVEFNPAHAAFCFPMLCHVNAIHTYWYMLNSFSTLSQHSLFRGALFVYWFIVLILGSLTVHTITAMYLCRLPKWTRPCVNLEKEPPTASETIPSDVLCSGDAMIQSLVSPTVLQANETGVLVRVRRDSEDDRSSYMRTCQMASIGFEPTMSPSAVIQEREELLQWVASHAPQPRHSRMMSTPDGYIQPDSRYGTTFSII
mmetsp:Transcript_15671/g.22327  ORF Transcript_15671/g.22327 Transcript_15671/m.22327 type:complete len:230 (+) Transcript_15671:1421-2110(+)